MLPASLFVLDREILSLASRYTESGRPCQEPKDVKTYIDQQLCKCYMNSFQPRTSHSLQSFRIASTKQIEVSFGGDEWLLCLQHLKDTKEYAKTSGQVRMAA